MKRQFITIISIVALLFVMSSSLFPAQLPSVAAQTGNPGLVAAYGFEEGSGTTLFDQSGNTNHGALTNGPVWVTTGRFGRALRFDGANDFVSIPDANSLDLTNGMTLEAWVYPTATPTGWDAIVLKEHASGLVYSLYSNGQGLNYPHVYITINGAEQGTGGGTRLSINTWTHLAATFDGNMIRLYVNGTLTGSINSTGAIQTSTRGLVLGGSTVWNDEFFPGIIDEVRIYNRALSSSEIVADMQAPVVGSLSTTTSTPTNTVSSTSTRTATGTATPTRTPTVTATATQTLTFTSTASSTFTNTATVTPTFMATVPVTVTDTPATEPLQTPVETPTGTPFLTATDIPTGSSTPLETDTPTLFPTYTLTFSPTSSPTLKPGTYIYPLKASANGRYFVDQFNQPFFINGDTAWSLIGQVSREDAEYYLQDAATKGINSVIVTLTENYFADNAPANYYGDQPFLTPGKFTTPNEPYFAHADWVINKAAQYGIQVILAPNYLGCCDDGWWDELMNNNTVADAAWYGNYIGNRYKNFPNIMYSWGNDINPCGYNSTVTVCTQRDKIRAMAQAVFDADPNHLHTYHATPEFSALDIFNPVTDPWLTANITYTYQPVQIKTLQDYNRGPVMPFFLFESHYETDWANAQPVQMRRQAYIAVLSGAAGHHYGNNPIWHMNGKPGDTTNTWKLHLDDEGRADLPHVRALFESRLWYTLIPDQDHSLITAGYGSPTGDDYVGAALTSTGSTAIVYIPVQKQITVDMTRVTGASLKAWWFDPRTGSAQLIGIFPATGSRNFTPPTYEDWVLVIDDADLVLPAPGAGGPPLPTPIPSATLTPTSTPTPTVTPSPTLTPSRTPSATSSPTLDPSITITPTATPQPETWLYLSSISGGTVGGVAFADEDVVLLNKNSNAWTLYLDGSDVGIAGDIDGFHIMANGDILLSLETSATVGTLGTVDDSDIIRFVPASLGSSTAGTFQWYFDGSDVGLTTNSENIDALGFAPDGSLILSTNGTFGVTGVAGEDEDLLAFSPTSLGVTTSGSWSLYFDGSDVGLNTTNSEDINGIWIDPGTNQIYLTTVGSFSVTGVSGGGADILICTPITLGVNTACTFDMYWVGSSNGFSGQVIDGLQIFK